MYVIKMHGCQANLLAWYDAVGGEGADGWISLAAKEAKPVIRACQIVVWDEGEPYWTSGASGSFSHPRVGTRKTRIFKISSFSS